MTVKLTSNIKRFIKFSKLLLPYWKIEGIILLLTLATVPLSLVNPYISKLVIDKAYGNKDLRLFIILAVIGGAVFLINTLLRSISSFLKTYIDLKVTFDLRRKFFYKIKKLDLTFFQDRTIGENMYKASHDVDSVASFIVDTVPEFIRLIPRVIFVLIMVIYLDWKLALLSIILAPLLYLPPYYFTKRLRRILNETIRISEQIFNRLHRIFTSIYLIKVFGKETSEARKYIRKVIESIRLSTRNAKLEAFGSIASHLFNRGVTGLIVLYGGYRIIRGDLTLGSLTAIMIYLNQLIGLQGSFASFYQTSMLGLVSCERLDKILEITPKIKESPFAIWPIFTKGDIEFKDVTFFYKPNDLVLDNISLKIAPYSNIALIGHSGCGKTTLLSLLLRLFEPQKGNIYIEGCDIRDLKFKALRDQIGIALQEPFLWDDTIENNIRYAKEKATFQEIEKAVKISQIEDFIIGLPQGYKTVIGEAACKLSQGQKQRIAIARAVIKRPKILILDEAMSSLDSETEDKIIDNIKREFIDTVIIIVSHRISTVKKMDLVYFLESNSNMIVATHDELLNKVASYSELFASQITEEIRVKAV